MAYQAWNLFSDPDYLREQRAWQEEEDAFQREEEARQEHREDWWHHDPVAEDEP